MGGTQTASDLIEASHYLVLATADGAGRRGAAIGTGQGVYMSAVAELLEDSDQVVGGVAAFSRRSVAHGGREWTSGDLRPGAGLRLYRATADSHWILAKDGTPDHRVPVSLVGRV